MRKKTYEKLKQALINMYEGNEDTPLYFDNWHFAKDYDPLSLELDVYFWKINKPNKEFYLNKEQEEEIKETVLRLDHEIETEFNQKTREEHEEDLREIRWQAERDER